MLPVVEDIFFSATVNPRPPDTQGLWNGRYGNERTRVQTRYDIEGNKEDHVGEWCASTPFCSSRGHLTGVSLFSLLSFPLPRTRLSYFKFSPASSCLYTSLPTPPRES